MGQADLVVVTRCLLVDQFETWCHSFLRVYFWLNKLGHRHLLSPKIAGWVPIVMSSYRIGDICHHTLSQVEGAIAVCLGVQVLH